jgi:hypothetical protein
LQLRVFPVLHERNEFGDCSIVDDPLQVGLSLIFGQQLPQSNGSPMPDILFPVFQSLAQLIDLAVVETFDLELMNQRPEILIDNEGVV